MEIAALDRQAFRAWLERNAEFVVGWPGSAQSCPVARWQRDVTGAEVGVGLNVIHWSRYDPRTRESTWHDGDLPAWACAFVDAFDASAGPFASRIGREALAVLDSLPEEL